MTVTLTGVRRDVDAWIAEAEKCSDTKYASALEVEKIKVCTARIQEREAALSYYAATDYRIRAMRYAVRSDIFMGHYTDPEAVANVLYEDIDEALHVLRDEHPVTMYWRDHHITSWSERLFCGTNVLEGLLLHAGGYPRESMWSGTVHSVINASFPWVGAARPFYSLLDAKAWVEWVIKGGGLEQCLSTN